MVLLLCTLPSLLCLCVATIDDATKSDMRSQYSARAAIELIGDAVSDLQKAKSLLAANNSMRNISTNKRAPILLTE